MDVAALIVAIAAFLVAGAAVVYARIEALEVRRTRRAATAPTFSAGLVDRQGLNDGMTVGLWLQCTSCVDPLDEVTIGVPNGDHRAGIVQLSTGQVSYGTVSNLGAMSSGERRTLHGLVQGDRSAHPLQVIARCGPDRWALAVDITPPPYPPQIYAAVT